MVTSTEYGNVTSAPEDTKNHLQAWVHLALLGCYAPLAVISITFYLIAGFQPSLGQSFVRLLYLN